MKMRDVVLCTDLHEHPDDDAEKAAQLRHKRILHFRPERDHLLVRPTHWSADAAYSAIGLSSHAGVNYLGNRLRRPILPVIHSRNIRSGLMEPDLTGGPVDSGT
jgi:hypothetical protein